MLAWTTGQLLAFAALVSLPLAAFAIVAPWRQSVTERREQREEQARRRLETQHARATMLELTVVPGEMISGVVGAKMLFGEPSLHLHNAADSPVTNLNVGIEADQQPHGGIGYVAYLASGDEDRIVLPAEHSRLMVTWTDIDGVPWARKHVGQEFIIERLPAADT